MVYMRLLQQFIYARRNKRQPRLPVLSSTAIVNTELSPRGSVFVRGELWTAEASGSDSIRRDATVQVVGFRNHVLLVDDKS